MARGRIKIRDEKLEQAKVSLNNANVIADIKSNPVVDRNNIKGQKYDYAGYGK